jgi:hypothetical protein
MGDLRREKFGTVIIIFRTGEVFTLKVGKKQSTIWSYGAMDW